MIPDLRWFRFPVKVACSLAEADGLRVELLRLDWRDPEVDELRACSEQPLHSPRWNGTG